MTEFLTLEYAGSDKLYVPVSSLHSFPATAARPRMLRRCTSSAAAMGEGQGKGGEAVRDTAAELLALYAQRAAREGYAFKLKAHDYEASPTDFVRGNARPGGGDQGHAGRPRSGKPMDRLICGDVGFGRRKWRCAPAFVAVAEASRSRCWCRPAAMPNSTQHPFLTVSRRLPTRAGEDRGLSRSAPVPRPPRRLPSGFPARSTSRSARTSCSPAT